MISRLKRSSTISFLSIFSFIHPHSLSGYFFHQPKFSPCASWNATAITFVTNETIGAGINGLFVDMNNTVYIANRLDSRVLIWHEGSTSISRTMNNSISRPLAIFVMANGDIYIVNALPDQIRRFPSNGTTSEILMNMSSNCMGFFIDLNNTAYCSVLAEHYILKKSLSDVNASVIIAAGNGSNGTGPYQLNQPRGIFVDRAFNLYVADRVNQRIQRFACGQLNGTTVVGSTVAGTITLRSPIAITFDADDYIFIADSNNDRIVGSGPFGFRCIVGCIGQGSTANRMNNPQTFYFDSYGNIFVIDRINDRVQKFFLASNYCEPTTTMVTRTTQLTHISNSTHENDLENTTQHVVESTQNNDVSTSTLELIITTEESIVDTSSSSTTIVSLTTYAPSIALTTQTMAISSTADATTAALTKEITTIPSTTNTTTAILTTDTTTSIGLTQMQDTSTALVLTTAISTSSESSHSTTTNDTTMSSVKIMTSTSSSFSSKMISPNPTTPVSTSSVSTQTTQNQRTTISLDISSTATTGIDVQSTMRARTNSSASQGFNPPRCSNPEVIGTSCNVSSTPCDILHPCQNNGKCVNNKSVSDGYICECPWGFDGDACQLDIRPCKNDTCWNNGTCLNTSMTEYICICAQGWTDLNCATKIDYCQNITCQNNGVCRPLFQDYQCECSSPDYSGRHCEITAAALVTRKTVSKSFSYVAILFISIVLGFIVLLDILKYAFHIDPVRIKRRRMKRRRTLAKQPSLPPKPRIITRFVYVDSVPANSNNSIA